MVKIRLSRIGKKKVPFYKIIVSDSKSPIHGRFIEQIGTYDPNTNPGTVKIDEEKALKWIANGAQPTDTVSKLFKMAGVGKGGAKKTAHAEKKEEAPVEEAVAEAAAEA